MWGTCFVFLVLVLVWRAWKAGPNQAVGQVAALSLLVPTWVTANVWGLDVDLRIASGIAALGAYCVHPKSMFRTKLVLVDFAAIGVVATHLASDWSHDGFDWRVPLQAYGEWVVPYLGGRVAIQSWEDARALLPTFLVVCVVFAVSAAVESITEFNLFELPFGVRPMEGPPRDLSRWGIKRAYGPVMNPIYFGMLQMLLFPWTMYGAAAAMRKSGPRWWRVAPVVAGVGVCCTASRAPMLGLAVLLYASAVLLLPHWRRILLGVGFATLLALVINYQAVLDGLNLTEGGTKAGRRQKIAVGGESVEYSSTMHRVYVIEVYSKAMGHAGLLGFGTDRTSEFPPRVPFASEHIQALQRLRSVDNCYILVILRFGLLGLFFFVSVGVTSVVAYARHAWGEGLRRGALAAGMAGAMLATMAAFLTVWMPHDFGFWFLWCAGAAGGLHAHLGANRPKSQRHKSDNTRDLS